MFVCLFVCVLWRCCVIPGKKFCPGAALLYERTPCCLGSSQPGGVLNYKNGAQVLFTVPGSSMAEDELTSVKMFPI